MWMTTSGSWSANARSTASPSRTSTRRSSHVAPDRAPVNTRVRSARRRQSPMTSAPIDAQPQRQPRALEARVPGDEHAPALPEAGIDAHAGLSTISIQSMSVLPSSQSSWARALDTVISFSGRSGRNASGPTSPVVLAEPISLPVPGSGLPPPRATWILWIARLEVVQAQRHVVAGVGLLPLDGPDLPAVDADADRAADRAAQVDRVVAVDRQLDLAVHLARRARDVVRRLGESSRGTRSSGRRTARAAARRRSAPRRRRPPPSARCPASCTPARGASSPSCGPWGRRGSRCGRRSSARPGSAARSRGTGSSARGASCPAAGSRSDRGAGRSSSAS